MLGGGVARLLKLILKTTENRDNSIHRVSYMSAHVLLNLLNEKIDEM